jgi:hypothetical protein
MEATNTKFLIRKLVNMLVGPIFFENTINFKMWMQQILYPLFKQVTGEPLQAFPQHNSTSGHAVREITDPAREVSGGLNY